MRRTDLLALYGITDHAVMVVQAIKVADTFWRVGINGEGEPLKPLLPEGALRLAEHLREIGEIELAQTIAGEAETVRRYIRQDVERSTEHKLSFRL